MNKKFVINLIKFALKSEILSFPSAAVCEEWNAFLDANAERELVLSVLIMNEDGVPSPYEIDFSQENIEKSPAIKYLREQLPIVEVIDLIYFALDCQVVQDVTPAEHNFLSFDMDYCALCNEKTDVFEFCMSDGQGQDIVYKLTFNKKRHDPRSKTEYATRSSMFVDLLIRKIMAKYNILLVHKASLNTSVIPEFPLADGFITQNDTKDTETETNVIQNHLKVLIRYNDTAENKSFSESVIDDIYITFSDHEELKFDFFNIVPNDSDKSEKPDLHYIRNLRQEEFDNIKNIKNFVEKRERQFQIFDELRLNENTNLYKLIQSRKPVYREEAKKLGKAPKVEFTVTPLSIYSNHIVTKIITHVVTYANPLHECLHNISCVYEQTYDPTSKDSFSYVLNGEEISKEDPLVIALSDNPIKLFEDKDQDFLQKLSPCLVPLSQAINLHKENAGCYGEKFSGLYFLRTAIEPNYEGKPCLKNDLKTSTLTGKKWHYTQLKKLPLHHILTNGKPYSNAQTLGYIEGPLWHCNRCNAIWGAMRADWVHRNANIPNPLNNTLICCCDDCLLTYDLGPNGTKNLVPLKNVNGGYFADIYNGEFDLQSFQYTEVCNACACKDKNTNKEKYPTYLYKKDIKQEDVCIVCEKIYCKTHIDSKTHICDLCTHTLESFPDPREFSTKNNGLNPKTNKEILKIWRLLSPRLKVSHRRKSLCSFTQTENELRLWVTGKKHITLYYFIRGGKRYFLKKIHSWKNTTNWS